MCRLRGTGRKAESRLDQGGAAAGRVDRARSESQMAEFRYSTIWLGRRTMANGIFATQWG